MLSIGKKYGNEESATKTADKTYKTWRSQILWITYIENIHNELFELPAGSGVPDAAPPTRRSTARPECRAGDVWRFEMEIYMKRKVGGPAVELLRGAAPQTHAHCTA